MMTIDELPRDIVIRIISIDLSLAPTIYKLNRRLHDIFYFDPNVNKLIKLKFYALIDWNIHNKFSTSDVFLNIERNPIIIANTLPQIKLLIDIAVGHPSYSLNKYLSLLMKFGTSINRQIALLQKKITNAVNETHTIEQIITTRQHYKLSKNGFHELISMWYELKNRTEIMYNRMRYWMKYQIEMEEIVKLMKNYSIEWQNKLKWVLEKDNQFQQQFDSYFSGDDSFEDMIQFFTTNIVNQRQLFQSSFIGWIATQIQRKDMINNLETIIDITKLTQSFHDAFSRMFEVIQSMKEMTNDASYISLFTEFSDS